MKFASVPIDSIRIGPRARKDLGNTEDIEESAKGFAGQIQSLAVCAEPHISAEGHETFCGYGLVSYREEYILLAGARRLEAFKKAGLTEVLVRIYPPSLTELERKSVELIENAARLNMSWQDQVSLTEEIHNLQIEIHGERISPADEEGWSQAKTAAMLGKHKASISHDLSIAKAIKEIPELRECKSKHEVENILARIEEEHLIAELASREEKRSPETPIDVARQNLIDSFIIGDFFSLIKEVEDSSIDLIDLDPPYGIEYVKFGGHAKDRSDAIAAHARQHFETFETAVTNHYDEFLRMVLEECFRVMKPNSWLIMWYAQDPWAEVVYRAIIKAGFKAKRLPAVWCKDLGGSGMRPSAAPDVYLGRVHETFIYARKGNAIIRKRARADVFHCKTPPHKGRIHPTEKPEELMRDILETFAMPGSKILVPFLGGGNTLFAAANLGMRAKGFEWSKEFKDGFIIRASQWEPPRR